MNVTPSAVSHQIKALEDFVGAALFVRSVRAVRLTELGRALAQSVGAAFDGLEVGLARARAGAGQARLKVSALPLFTNVWLVPRLGGFEAAHPGIAIAIETTNRLVDFDTEDFDVAIRNVYAPTPGLASRKLLDLYAVPLCAPKIARTLDEPADLAGATLIDVSARAPGWPEWLEAIGLKGLRPKGTLSFDTVPSALEAAAQGRGVLLGLAPLIFDAPAAKGLTVPFEAPRISAGSYFVVCRRSDLVRPLVRAFIDWITAEMRTDAQRLAGAARRSTAAPAP